MTLSVFLLCLSAKADEWTDENGTVWTFNVSNGNARLYKGWQSPCISGTIPANLVIPATVYSGETAYPVTAIGDHAFLNCSSLTSINIPEGVTAIENAAFSDCNMAYMFFGGNTPCTLSDKSSIATTATLIVPDDAVDTYRTAWPDFQNVIIGSSDNVLMLI